MNVCCCSGEEEWVPVAVQSLAHTYQVSSAGRVRSVQRVIHGRLFPSHVIRPQPKRRGYLYVWLWLSQSRFVFRLHRLVAYSFLPEPLDYEDEVNHVDGDVAHCCVKNLSWLHGTANRDDRNRRQGWGPYARG